jgi:hypothetical protein
MLPVPSGVYEQLIIEVVKVNHTQARTQQTMEQVSQRLMTQLRIMILMLGFHIQSSHPGALVMSTFEYIRIQTRSVLIAKHVACVTTFQ